MVADSEVSREPQSLQKGLSASQREHPSSPVDPVSVSAGTTPQTSQLEDTADEQQLHGTVGKLIEAITEFFEEAEKSIGTSCRARDRRHRRGNFDWPPGWTTLGVRT